MSVAQPCPPHRSDLRFWTNWVSGGRRTRPLTVVMALLSVLVAAGVSAVTALPASAAPGDPFNSAAPMVFIAQGVPTRLYQATTDGAGTTSFTPVGPAANFQYNSIGYNPANNYIYAISRSAGNATNGAPLPLNSLIRIGQDGVITGVGSTLYGENNVGAFGADGNLYVMFGNSTSFIRVINPVTGLPVRTINLSAIPEVSDFVYKDGYFWGNRNTNGQMVRIDPATGVVNFFAAVVPAASGYGAVWTYGNDNLGFSNNDTGTIYQIEVTNPSAATPTFTVISANAGPPNGNNDGTSSQGIPTDLAISKAGPAKVTAGGTLTYTLQVTNNGIGTSSGFVVTDTVPSPLTTVASSTSGCTVSGNQVTCVSGTLAVGASQTFTITAAAPGTITSCVTNTATVLANETDSNSANDSSSATSCPTTTITVAKQVAGRIDAADQFTVALADSAGTALTSTTTTGTGSTATSTPVTVTKGETYTVSDALAAGSDLTNYSKTASCTGANTGTSQTLQGGGPQWTFAPPALDDYTCTVTNTAKAATLGIVKHAAPPVDVNADGLTDAGDRIAYSFTVSNTGDVTMNNITVNDPKVGAVTCPSATLTAGGSQLCTADSPYTVTSADVTSGSVDNSATAAGTPPGSSTPRTSAPSTTKTATTAPNPALTLEKSVDPSSASAAGASVTYSFLVTNTGNVTINNAGVTEGTFTGSGTMSPITCPAAMASLAPAAQATCTATYTVTQADVDAGSVSNTGTASGTPQGSTAPIASAPDTATIQIDAEPSLSVLKSASPETAHAAGQIVSYSFSVTNTGNVTMRDVTVSEGAFSGSGSMSAISCPAGATSMAPAAQLTCTATYLLTQADLDAGQVTNAATVTGTAPRSSTPIPPSAPSTTTVTVAQAPSLSVDKSASPSVVGTVGDQISYEFLVTNTGNVTLTQVRIDEGTFTGSGDLSAVSCPAQPASLAPGAQTTCTAGYAVTQADLDEGSVRNTATATATPPSGPAVTSLPSTVTVTSSARGVLMLTKRAHPVDLNSNGVTDTGDRIDWSIEVANTGTATVRDITVSDPTAGQVTCAESLLGPGGSMTCVVPSHPVTDADVATGSVRNTATATGTGSRGEITSNAATATVTLATDDADAGDSGDAGDGGDPGDSGATPTVLPHTGVGEGTLFAGVGGVLALLVGLILLFAARLRPETTPRRRS